MLKTILAEKSTSISEFKKNPMAVMDEGEGMPIAILNHNQPAFYCLTQDHYEELLEKIDDLELIKTIQARESLKTFEVNVDEL